MQSLTTENILAQIAPQRSTQYATLASDLAPAELVLSPLGPSIQSITSRSLGNQSYLQLALSAPLEPQMYTMLGSLAMTTAYFTLHEQIGDHQGPFLQPIEIDFIPGQPRELVTTRRYRGKTNELFTHWLCNIAKFSSAFAADSWESITLLDPLAGGGTTLFAGLMLGAKQVAGIEQDAKDGKSTATFLKQFANENRIPVRLKEERLKKLGKRWSLSLGESPELRNARSQTHQRATDGTTSRQDRNSADRQSFLWAQGDSALARDLLPGVKPHLIVADLPYGIQHQGQLISLLESGMPAWLAMLRHGGAIALAWDATRFPAPKMMETLKGFGKATLLREPPYDQISHRVDRIIKERDVAVLRL